MPDTSTRYIGWCPICEGDFKVRGEHLVHHGFQRPGIGYIVGDCPGVGYNPYELSTQACTVYRSLLLIRIPETEDLVEVYRSDPPGLEMMFDDYDIEAGRVRRYPIHQGGGTMTVMLDRDQADELEAQLPAWQKGRYSWETKLKHIIAIQVGKLSDMRRELRRTEKLIAEWPGVRPLRTVEEEINRQEQTRAEREHARVIARDAKIAAEVVKIRGRIDSAVRNRNAGALADIFRGTRLREVSGWRLSDGDALALLERDHVWRAFGLLDSAADVQGILRSMRSAHPERPLKWPEELGGGFAKSRH